MLDMYRSGEELVRFPKSWGQMSRTRGHTATTMEMLSTRSLVNHWRDLNQNLHDVLFLGDELITFWKSLGQRSRLTLP